MYKQILRTTCCSLVLLFVLGGCGQSVSPESDLAQQEILEEITGVAPVHVPTDPEPMEELVLSTTEGVDIDLTQLSSSVVYGLVFQMLFNPEDYVGQVIRMSGEFFHYTNPDTGKHYFSTIVADATACCTQGLEFLLPHTTDPADYPVVASRITVTGVLETYEEFGYTNIRLVDAELM